MSINIQELDMVADELVAESCEKGGVGGPNIDLLARAERQGIIIENKRVTMKKLPNISISTIRLSTDEDLDDIDLLITANNFTRRVKQTELDDFVKEAINKGYVELKNPILCRYLSTLADVATKAALTMQNFAYRGHTLVGYKGNNYYGIRSMVEYDANIMVPSTYYGDLELEQCGNMENYLHYFNAAIKGKPVVGLVMAAALSGVMRSAYWENDSEKQIVISLYGDQGKGKTSLETMANTIFGSSIESYNATQNCILEEIPQRGCIVSTIDDIIQIKDLKVNSPVEMQRFIFDLASGSGKRRLKGTGKPERKKKNACSSIIISLTVPFLPMTGVDAGQAARIIEVPVRREDVADSEAELERLLRGLQHNQGNMADAFAFALCQYEHGKDEPLANLRYFDAKEALNKRLHDNRYANRAALILATAILANDLVGTEFDIQGIENLLVERLNYQYLHFQKNNIKLDVISASDRLYGYFEKNKEYFKKDIFENFEERNRFIGIYRNNPDGSLELLIPDNKTDVIMPYLLNDVDPEDIIKIRKGENVTLSRILDTKEILKFWNKVGIIRTSRKGLKARLTLVSGDETEVAYDIVLPAFERKEVI